MMDLVLSIQLSVFVYSPKSQIGHRGLKHLYTYDIPDLWPQIRSGKTPPQKKKNNTQGKKGNTLSGEQQRRIPLPGWTEQ